MYTGKYKYILQVWNSEIKENSLIAKPNTTAILWENLKETKTILLI